MYEVIIFFGADGAGKTTQARLLMKYLRSHKSRPRLAWLRARHSLAFLLACFFVRFGHYQIEKAPSGVKFKTVSSRLLVRLQPLWGAIEFASVLPWIFLRVYFPKFLGYTVVAERYVIDTVVHLSYWLGNDFLQNFLSRVLLGFIPQGSMLVHLDAETQVLLERSARAKDNIASSFIIYQRRIYQTIAENLGAITVNTSKLDTEATFNSILKILIS